jgi:hypothetical protein
MQLLFGLLTLLLTVVGLFFQGVFTPEAREFFKKPATESVSCGCDHGASPTREAPRTAEAVIDVYAEHESTSAAQLPDDALTSDDSHGRTFIHDEVSDSMTAIGSLEVSGG